VRKEILSLLETDPRLPLKDIAVMIGAREEEVAQELARLEQEKIILGYRAVINWEKVEHNLVSALIDVKVTPQRQVGFDELAEKIYRFPEVKAVFLMSGSYDLSVQVEGKTLRDVARFVSEKLAALDHVQSTTTHFVLKKYKEAGIMLEESEKDRRQVVTP